MGTSVPTGRSVRVVGSYSCVTLNEHRNSRISLSVLGKGAYSLLASGLRRPRTRDDSDWVGSHRSSTPRGSTLRAVRSAHQRRIRATGHESAVRVRRTT